MFCAPKLTGAAVTSCTQYQKFDDFVRTIIVLSFLKYIFN